MVEDSLTHYAMYSTCIVLLCRYFLMPEMCTADRARALTRQSRRRAARPTVFDCLGYGVLGYSAGFVPDGGNRPTHQVFLCWRPWLESCRPIRSAHQVCVSGQRKKARSGNFCKRFLLNLFLQLFRARAAESTGGEYLEASTLVIGRDLPAALLQDVAVMVEDSSWADRSSFH